jgi:RimJ/RimL family protein N-acetyltransferase
VERLDQRSVATGGEGRVSGVAVRLSLAPVTDSIVEASETDAKLARELGASIAMVSAALRDAIRQTKALRERTGAPVEWSGFIGLDGDSNAVVGICGFTAAPDADGRVEIAYHTFPPFEGKGYAGAMAAGLAARARTQGARAILAHTLREANASTRILERLGFARDGEATDPDAGTVWRWRLEIA